MVLPLVLCLLTQTVVRAELYGWWPLDDGSGDEARDLGPRHENGLIADADTGGLGDNSSVWVQDPSRGTVLGLAGTTSWVAAGSLPMMDLDNDFSWAFWARQDPSQATPATDIVIGNRYGESGTDTAPREFIKFTPDRFEYHMNATGNNDLQYANGPGIPSNDTWIHHSVVKDGSTLTYYRDGQLGNSKQILDPMFSVDELPLALGGQNGVETWRGYLSDVQLYESALSQTEVQSIMPGAVLANRNLYGRWKLDDGPASADVAKDSGPRGEDGLIADWDIDGLAGDGSVWVQDPERGMVLGLGGNTAWVAAGSTPIMDLENDFTWNFWARQDPGQASPANDIILGNRYDESGVDTVPREFIKFTPNRFEYHMNGAGNNDLYYDSNDIPDIPSNDQWIHHVVVKDGDQLTYYRDGAERGARTIQDEMLSPDPLPFAMGGQNGVETWIGYLSDVRLFDHALTPEEIADIIGGLAVRGDYNDNGELDASDLDLQAAAIVENQHPAKFDLNNDQQVDFHDRMMWLHDLKKTWVGDTDLNGLFDSGDFVQVFSAGRYETVATAGWKEGDWDGNQVFDSSDFVAAFSDGGYEIGPRPAGAVRAVPEPSSVVLLLLGMTGLLRATRRHWERRR